MDQHLLGLRSDLDLCKHMPVALECAGGDCVVGAEPGLGQTFRPARRLVWPLSLPALGTPRLPRRWQARHPHELMW